MSRKRFVNPFKTLSSVEWGIWFASLTAVAVSFLIMQKNDYLALITALIGASAVFFVSKGHIIGQMLTVVFAILYGIVSFIYGYYGEIVTYVGMIAPTAIIAIISWFKNSHKQARKSRKSHIITNKQILIMILSAVCVSVAFFFILRALNTPRLLISVASIFTVFIAVYLTFLRSSNSSLVYAANDIVLIVLWVLATRQNSAYAPMVVCFIIFLANDIYGFIDWKRNERIRRRK